MANEEHLVILDRGVGIWNEWREDNPDITPDLSGASLRQRDLSGFNLSKAKLSDADLSKANLSNADLSRANLSNANLRNVNLFEADCVWVKLNNAELGNANIREARLNKADLSNADLSKANLCNAKLRDANLCGAKLNRANLTEATLSLADLSGANLLMANLHKAELFDAKLCAVELGGADLSCANLNSADLCGADLSEADLCSAKCQAVMVDGKTLMSNCKIDKNTDFRLVGLDNMRIGSGTKQLLQYNIRRRRWLEWCFPIPRKKTVVKCLTLLGPVTWLFWWMSDYGKSTLRVIGSFFSLAMIFAVLYWNFDGWLRIDGREGLTDFVHACYFSIVTMTTLGFGDIHANPDNQAGQIALMVQVLLGYVMLGVLVTRIAVLFTTGGPAGKFVKMKKEIKAKPDET